MDKEQEIREQLAKEIIDAVFDNAENLAYAMHYGEELILASDIVNLINNTAGTDYMRYGHGVISYGRWNPHKEQASKCGHCRRFFTFHEKSEHSRWCLGKEDASGCMKFEDTLE